MAAVNELAVQNAGLLTYKDERGINCSARFDLYLIRLAWNAGCDFEDLADGFGAGMGTAGGDWSGIRDSSDEATVAMTERALNFVTRAVKKGGRRGS